MTDEHDDRHDDDSLDGALNRGFEVAGDAAKRDEPAPGDSVIERIGEVTGKKPNVSLRDAEEQGQTPMLKPLGPDDERAAGKYMVHGELGRGGVGAVHRGHDQELGRDVAMKFLHEKYKDHPDILHRFVEEAQIGGQLQHPGIVPVYDLGMSDGKPFFTMKLVKGKTLAQSLSDRKSVADDRRRFLAIFEQICQTMAYAHVRGVVHRDLKPANIMIGSFGEVQVVDWGMGKVLERGGVADEKRAAEKQSEPSVIETVRSSGHGTQSVMGSVMGTPAYMPPEQALGDVERMDERSDVFALGAILCEILTGLPPYVGEVDELIGMAAMSKLDNAHERLADCGADTELVDLATQCILPAPAARPKSAKAVAERIHDYLAQVEAKLHEAQVLTAEERIRAAAARTKQRLAFGVIAIALIGLATSLWFWDDARNQRGIAENAAKVAADERDEADRQRSLAVARADDLARVADFQSNQLTRVPLELMGADLREAVLAEISDADRTRVEQALDRVNFTNVSAQLLRAHVLDPALAAIDAEFVGRPGITASLLEPVSATMEHIGLLDRALDLRRRALEIRRQQDDTEDSAIIEATRRVGALLRMQGRQEEARLFLEAAVATAEASLNENDSLVESTRQSLAVALDALGHDDEAKALYEQCLASSRARLGDEHRSTLGIRANLARLELKSGEPERAATMLRDVLETQRRVLGSDNRDAVLSLDSLAAALRLLGRYEDAELLGKEALERLRRVRGDRHPITARALITRANILIELGRGEEAEAMLREALAFQRESLGIAHDQTRETLNSLAGALATQAKFSESESHFRMILTVDEAWPVDQRHLPARFGLSQVLLAQGRNQEAEALARRALAVATETLGASSDMALLFRRALGDAYKRLGRLEDAEPHLRAALTGLRESRGDRDPDSMRAMHHLGLALAAMGRREEAIPMLREAIALRREVHGPTDVRTLQTILDLSVSLSLPTERTEALELLDTALVDMRAALGDRHEVTLSALHQRGFYLKAQGDFEGAERALREAVAGWVATVGGQHKKTVSSRYNLGATLMRSGKFEDTLPVYHAILPHLLQIDGGAPRRLCIALNNIGYSLLELGKPTEAEPYLHRSAKLGRSQSNDDPRHLLTALWNLTRSLSEQENFGDLLTITEELVALAQRVHGTEHRATQFAKGHLGRALLETGRHEQAIPILRTYCADLERVFAPNDAALIRARIHLGTALFRTGNWDEAQAFLTKAQTTAEEGGHDEPNRQAIERLVELFEARHAAEPDGGHDAQRDAWRRRLPEK